MSDTLGTIRELIIQDKKASNVEKLHKAAMAEIAAHLSWLAFSVKLGLFMIVLQLFFLYLLFA